MIPMLKPEEVRELVKQYDDERERWNWADLHERISYWRGEYDRASRVAVELRQAIYEALQQSRFDEARLILLRELEPAFAEELKDAHKPKVKAAT